MSEKYRRPARSKSFRQRDGLPVAELNFGSGIVPDLEIATLGVYRTPFAMIIVFER